MRKLTILGVGALTTVALAFGSASPASSVPLPGSVGDTVCVAVPSGLAGLSSQVAGNAIGGGLLADAVTSSAADLTVKTTALVAALVAHVTAIDTNGPVATTSSAVGTAVSAYSSAAALWVQTVKDLDANEMAGEVLSRQFDVLISIANGLGCAGSET